MTQTHYFEGRKETDGNELEGVFFWLLAMHVISKQERVTHIIGELGD